MAAAAYLCIVMERTRLGGCVVVSALRLSRGPLSLLRRPDLCEYSVREGEGEAASAETAFLVSKATVRLLGLLRSHPRPTDRHRTNHQQGHLSDAETNKCTGFKRYFGI